MGRLFEAEADNEKPFWVVANLVNTLVLNLVNWPQIWSPGYSMAASAIEGVACAGTTELFCHVLVIS